MQKFDLHIHSDMSDGTFRPEELPALALERGVRHMALTDHDISAGCTDAIEAGKSCGVKVIAGIELDAENPTELHILGLGIDPELEKVKEYQRWRGESRAERGREILKKLRNLGKDVEPFVEYGRGSVTRLHIAKAIVLAGYARNMNEAFERYLSRGAPAYVPTPRIARREAVELIIQCGGHAVLAHPCKLKQQPHGLVRELADAGLWGIESFYPASTPGQKALFVSIGAQFGLVNTCGSDFHGKNRDTVIGCAWEDDGLLAPAFEELFD